MHAIFLIIDLRTTSIKIKVILCKIKIMKFAIIFFLLLVVSMFTIQNSFGKESDLFCKDGKILVYRVNAEKYACLNPPTAENWYKSGIAEPVEQIKSLDSEMKTHSLHSEKMTSSAALPDTSFGPQIDYSKGYLVEEIRDGLYWVTDGAYNTMFLTTGQGVIVVDAPPSIGENYLNAIAEVTEEPITHVIYSHTHNDHIGSASIFPDDAVYIAHKNAAASLEERNDPNRPLPTVTFDDTYVLEVGNQILELEYNGPMHEPGNIFIYAPNQKVLMAVDLIFPGWTPFKDLAMAQDVPAFLAAPDEILEYDFDVLVGGHLTRLGTVEDVKIQQEYFQDIQASAAKANQEVSFMEIGQQVGFDNPWLVFQIYADTISQQCTDEVVPKWIDRLGGVDLFTYDHCWKVSESQRID
jgi:glyoxylase-like metal-dependent hydrolase (beta-lactamase superfamily II)